MENVSIQLYTYICLFKYLCICVSVYLKAIFMLKDLAQDDASNVFCLHLPQFIYTEKKKSLRRLEALSGLRSVG